ncbi:hypothetical protein [Rubellimicrobium aerolatum]|uniref:HNH endonuclease n=1 Tax=Rubellimicrobium aerolatum TaxID=490979 RepID=A0ABW0SG62_9RHOB|nr:hypothetical protein [Rubellimicrobium aerolatum]MBP1807268.1 hypothetical protein [Rubellimicrobium aerolatum]
MPISLPSLPALVALRALQAEAAAAAVHALDDAQRVLGSYDVVLEVTADLPEESRVAVLRALARRLAAADHRTRACQARVDEAVRFGRTLRGKPSPVDLVEVPADLFEMLSPYLDDAMTPVLRAIAGRAGRGCSAEVVESYFPQPAAVA